VNLQKVIHSLELWQDVCFKHGSCQIVLNTNISFRNNLWGGGAVGMPYAVVCIRKSLITKHLRRVRLQVLGIQLLTHGAHTSMKKALGYVVTQRDE